MKKNLFITFEGIDGSGKSTQVKLLAEKLEEAGHKVYTTFEPTDSEIGTLLRSILTHKLEADEKTIAALFLADRLNHIQNKKDGILKKLEDGYTVITDRYYFSSYAYHGTHMNMDWVIQSNSLAADLLRPDINIYIDVDPDVSMERISKNRTSNDLYETSENLKKVRGKYMEAFETLKGQEHISVIDGNRTAELIAADIWGEVSKSLSI